MPSGARTLCFAREKRYAGDSALHSGAGQMLAAKHLKGKVEAGRYVSGGEMRGGRTRWRRCGAGRGQTPHSIPRR